MRLPCSWILSWNDVFWSGLLGFVVYGLVFIAERSTKMADMLEPLSSIVCAFLCCAIATYDSSINIPVVILSGIIVFVPGLALTIGLAELASRDLISGTARIMDAMMLLFKLYFGAFLGLAIGHALFGKIHSNRVNSHYLMVQFGQQYPCYL